MKLENAFSQSTLSFKLKKLPEYLRGATVERTNTCSANLNALVFSHIALLHHTPLAFTSLSLY